MTDIDKAIKEAKSDMLPYESWERMTGESGAAFAAFCAYRDCGLERNIRKAIENTLKGCEKDEAIIAKRYRVWRNYSCQYRWQERAAEFDRHIEHLKQTELRKTIEAQGEMHREVTGKMLDVVKKKLDTMNPAELSQGNLTEWVQTAIKAEREAAGLVNTNGKTETKQGELNFAPDFEGL
jgi:hypothetical protein